jgi:hypothetical protein
LVEDTVHLGEVGHVVEEDVDLSLELALQSGQGVGGGMG